MIQLTAIPVRNRWNYIEDYIEVLILSFEMLDILLLHGQNSLELWISALFEWFNWATLHDSWTWCKESGLKFYSLLNSL
jgi:hypothetical protein